VLRSILLGNDCAYRSRAVDDKCSPCRSEALLVVGPIGFAGLVVRPVPQQGDVYSELVGECGCRERRIDADAQNLGIGLCQLVLELPKARELVRSASGEGQRVEGENRRLLTQEILQRKRIPSPIGQRKLGRLVSNLNGQVSHLSV
jgi:hypothetical protein